MYPVRRHAALAAFLLAAVSSTAPSAQPRTDIAIAAPWHVSGLEPSQDGFIYQRMQVGETLVDVGANGALVPGLASGWEAAPGGLEWRFTIRAGVRFHDGSPLTAQAAAASLERARNRPGVLRGVPLNGIAAAGDAVVFTLKEPFAALPAVLANYATMILAPASLDASGAVVSFIGTGPFKVAEVSPPLSLKVLRFDGYWGGPATMTEARYLSSHRAETRALSIESGDAGLAFTLDPAGYTRLSRLKEVKVEAVAIPRVIMAKFNLARPGLADAKARRALSLAIDRQGIAKGILRFPEAAATQLFPPVVPDWHVQGLTPLARDVDEAKRLLAELGWRAGGDGVLARDGQRFSLTLRTFPNRPELPLIAAALQDQWRAIGVELKVSVGNAADIPAGHQDGSLDIGLHARNYAATPDPVVNAIEDFRGGGGDWGAMNWQAPDNVAKALGIANTAADAAERARAIREVAEALQAELPVLPIAWYHHTVAYPDKLEGVVVDPLERSYGLAKLRWTR